MAFYTVNNVETPASLTNQNFLALQIEGNSLCVWANNEWKEFVDKAYVDALQLPVGFILPTVNSANPATYLGYGTWSAFAQGRMLVGVDTNDADFDAAEKTGGSKTVTLTEAQMPSHTHVQNAHNHTQDAHSHGQSIRNSGTAGTAGTQGASTANNATAGTTATATATNQAATAVNQNTGGGQAHDNMSPFIAVYMFKRVS